jgi:hypothetical protein
MRVAIDGPPRFAHEPSMPRLSAFLKIVFSALNKTENWIMRY